MIAPEKVQYWAMKKEKENLKFRVFLKMNADEDELDRQFLALHNELFADYDCSKCRNCCKRYHGSIPASDIEKDARYLKMSKEEFIETYLGELDDEESYNTRNKPCDFLLDDGNCMLGDCKPQNCINYPYTNQPGRLLRLWGVVEAVSVCPIAYEIFERLKEEYDFKNKQFHY